MIKSRPLFEIRIRVSGLVDLGATPRGGRKIATVTGGEFNGARLRGEVLPAPAGDWLLVRADGVLTLDVRMTLRTHDDALIYMSYYGLRHGPAEVMARLAAGEPVDPDEYYFRITPQFETGAPAYAWLNRLMALGIGRREPQGPVYEVHEIL